jgi:parallel beta-helix repeat protein
MTKRIVSIFLAFSLALSLAVPPALAADSSDSSSQPASVSDSAEDAPEQKKEKSSENEEKSEEKSTEKPKEEEKEEESAEKSKEEEKEEKPAEKPKEEEKEEKPAEQPSESTSDSSTDPGTENSSQGGSSSSGSGSSSTSGSNSSSADGSGSSSSSNSGSDASSSSSPVKEEKTETQEAQVEKKKTSTSSSKTKSVSKDEDDSIKIETQESKNLSISEKVKKTKNVELISDQSYSKSQTITAATFSDYSNSTGMATGASISYNRLVTIQVTGLVENSTKAGQDNLAKIERAMDVVDYFTSQDKYSTTLFKVIIPAGTYYLDGTPVYQSVRCIHLYSNTWLSMNDVTFLKGDTLSRPQIRSGVSSEKISGYNGESNLILEGGTWDMQEEQYTSKTQHFTNVRFGHNQNVIIANVNFQGAVSGHHVELCGVQNVSIVGCTFADYKDSGYIKGINRNEAIQIDVTNSTNNTPTYANYDDTVSGNVVIYGCSFSNLSRGVGSHSASYGKYYDNMVIENNTFDNIKWQAIFTENYRNCAITRNTITNSGGGIECNTLTFAPDGNYYQPNSGLPKYADVKTCKANLVISNNKIKLKATTSLSNGSGIYVHGGVYNGSTFKKEYGGKAFRITDVTITGNTITSAHDAGIAVTYGGNYTISKNKISGVVRGSTWKGNGIYLYECTGGKVNSNTISGNASHGIYILSCTGTNSKRVALLSNKVTAAKGIGIYSRDSSYVGVAKSTVSAKSYALFFNNCANCYAGKKESYKNTLKSAAKYGVYVTGKSKTNLLVSWNNIAAGSKGVYAASGSKVTAKNNAFTKQVEK